MPCQAATERLEAAIALQQVCEEKYGLRAALKATFRPISIPDAKMDDLLAAMRAKNNETG